MVATGNGRSRQKEIERQAIGRCPDGVNELGKLVGEASRLKNSTTRPGYVDKYTFLTKLMNYEASFPIWFRQETPPLVIGIELDGHSRAYDWKALQKKRMVMDSIGDKHLLLLSSEDGTSPFAYHRTVDGQELKFEINGDQLTYTNTQSIWDLFGRCIEGKLKGKDLTKVQFYKQFIRGWISFRPDSTFYDFNS